MQLTLLTKHTGLRAVLNHLLVHRVCCWQGQQLPPRSQTYKMMTSLLYTHTHTHTHSCNSSLHNRSYWSKYLLLSQPHVRGNVCDYSGCVEQRPQAIVKSSTHCHTCTLVTSITHQTHNLSVCVRVSVCVGVRVNVCTCECECVCVCRRTLSLALVLMRQPWLTPSSSGWPCFKLDTALLNVATYSSCTPLCTRILHNKLSER